MTKNLSSFKHTFPVKVAAAVMLTASILTATVIAFLADPTRMVKGQITNKLKELEQSTTQGITPGSSPEDFMRIRSGNSTSGLIKVP
jgi:hypothetical protein